MKTIFLDTVGLIALWDRRDQWHAAAKSCLAAFDMNTTRLISTSFVLLECANHASRRPYRAEVVRMRDDLGMAGDLYDPLPEEISAAWEEYSQGIAGSASVVDLVSFAVMRRLALTQAFTNDRHYIDAGFEVLF